MPPAHTRVVHELVCRSLVKEAAEALAVAGIPVMPLKGALYARWIYDEPSDRLGGDVDLLVPETSFDAAVQAMAVAGFIPHPRMTTPIERGLRSPWAPIEIDLHRAVFGPGRYRLTTAELFARGQKDGDLFGAQVILPDPLDAFAHSVGHAASDHTPETTTKTRGDLARLAARFGLDPDRVAAHLEACGLGRAARYTLGLCARDFAFGRAVLCHLHPDPLGELLAGVERAVAARFDPMSIWGRVVGHLTNRSLPAAVKAVALAMVARV